MDSDKSPKHSEIATENSFQVVGNSPGPISLPTEPPIQDSSMTSPIKEKISEEFDPQLKDEPGLSLGEAVEAGVGNVDLEKIISWKMTTFRKLAKCIESENQREKLTNILIKIPDDIGDDDYVVMMTRKSALSEFFELVVETNVRHEVTRTEKLVVEKEKIAEHMKRARELEEEPGTVRQKTSTGETCTKDDGKIEGMALKKKD